MRIQSYILSAAEIIKAYQGAPPLAAWLKNYYKQFKKFGSRDRKVISHLCYCYYRLGGLFADFSIEEKVSIALFICSSASNPLLEQLNGEWNSKASLPVPEKLRLVGIEATELPDFSFTGELSPAIDVALFKMSMLVQPLVFLRLRPGCEESVMQKLSAAAVSFEKIAPFCLALESNIKIETLLELDKEAVVQDISSQQVLNELDVTSMPAQPAAWDCCAASGGKSLLLRDKIPGVQLTVSDVRQSILFNLQNRFAAAGVGKYRTLVWDVARQPLPGRQLFDVILCDAPCTGSGTWGRTPEQAHFFTTDRITHYTVLQKNIVEQAAKNLKPGGQLVYSTCSVFKAENEAVVDYIQKNTTLQLKAATYYKGYEQRGDTLFAAVFKGL